MTRTIKIKMIGKLTDQELDKLLSLEYIQNEIIEYAQGSEQFYIEEVLNTLAPGLSDWSIGAWNYSYMKYSNVDKIVRSLNEVQAAYGFIGDALNVKLEYINDVYSRCTLIEMYSEGYYSLEDLLHDLICELLDALTASMVSILEYFSDFETVVNNSDFTTYWLETYHDTEVAIDGNGIRLYGGL